MKILIGTPSGTSNVELVVATNMARCRHEWAKKHDIDWIVVPRTFVCKARMMIVDEARRQKADYLFWIDDDALVRTDILDKLLAHEKDIVIVPYPMRKPPYNCGVLKTKDGDIEDQESYINLDWEKDLNKGLVEVDGGGTHCMLTKVSVYGPPCMVGEKIEEYAQRCPGQVPYPWFVLAPFGGTEDMFFCLQARRTGMKIYCDTDLEAGHVGYPEIITSGNAKAWKRKYGNQTLGEVAETLPEGSSYIDVSDASSYVEMPTTKNISDVSVDAGNG